MVPELAWYNSNIAIITLPVDASNPNATYPWGTRISEHRINPFFVDAMNLLLDEVLASETASCLIVHGHGKFFCNGMDLLWIGKNQSQAETLQQNTELLLSRLLTFPIPTIAAINGHFCAAGAMFAFAFDYRITVDSSCLCFVPAVDLGLVYSSGMVELMKSKTPQHMHVDMIINSKRYTPQELKEFGVVQSYESKSEILPKTIEFVESALITRSNRFRGKKYRHSVQVNKERLFAMAFQHLTKQNVEKMGFEEGEWDANGRVQRMKVQKSKL